MWTIFPLDQDSGSTHNVSLVGLMITFNTEKSIRDRALFMRIKFVWSFLYFSTEVSKKCDNFELIYQSLGCIVLWNKNAIKAFLSAVKIINLNFLSKIQLSSSWTITSISNLNSKIHSYIFCILTVSVWVYLPCYVTDWISIASRKVKLSKLQLLRALGDFKC